MQPAFVRFGLVMLASLTLLSTASCRRGTPVAEIRGIPTAENAAAEPATALPTPDEADWPWWRGPSRDGVATGPAPTEWTATKNVVWKSDVPGRGHSSPTIWGQQVFLATADEGAQKMSLLAFNRDDGKLEWDCPLHEGGFMHVHQKNSQASPTAACDGTLVYWPAMVKGAIWVSAVTTTGKIAWQTEAGPFVSMHGFGASPVLFENLVIVAGDSNGPGWLAALDRTTGKIAWRVQRGNSASFGTPVIVELAGKPQLLLSGHRHVISYNLKTGDKLWQADGPAEVCANTIVTKGDLVFASGGYPQATVMAIRGDGSGQLVWKKDFKCYVPSMLVDGDRLLVPLDQGILRCLNTETGTELWNKRLGGDITASPVLADGKIFVTNEAGTTFVLQSGAAFKQLTANDAGQPCFSTPAICGGRIYLRTDHQLLCIGSEPRGAAAE